MVCAGTRKDPPPPDQLVGGHAYTVLGVMDGDSVLPKLIKLRNPWGEQQYNGPWSYAWLETRGMWQEAKILYKYSRDEFWMPFTMFTKAFSTLFICHDLGPEFSEKNTKSVLTKKNRKIRFKLGLKTSCGVTNGSEETERRTSLRLQRKTAAQASDLPRWNTSVQSKLPEEEKQNPPDDP